MSESALGEFTKETKDQVLQIFKQALAENDSELFFKVIYGVNVEWWLEVTNQRQKTEREGNNMSGKEASGGNI